MKQPVQFGDLGPSGLARRFTDADPVDVERLDRARAALSEASDRVGVKRGREVFGEAAVVGQAFVKEGRLLKGEDVLATLGPEAAKPQEERPSTYPARATEGRASGPKGGRPAKHGDRPWEAEGISRALWYRRRAAAKAGE